MASSKKSTALARIAALRHEADGNKIHLTLKSVRFVDPSKQALMSLGMEVMRLLGSELSLVQLGESPTDFKPMPSIGRGAYEIRAQTGQHWVRLFYVANLPDAIYVLDAISKTQNRTEQVDLDRAKARYKTAVAMSHAAVAELPIAVNLQASKSAAARTRSRKGK